MKRKDINPETIGRGIDDCNESISAIDRIMKRMQAMAETNGTNYYTPMMHRYLRRKHRIQNRLFMLQGLMAEAELRETVSELTKSRKTNQKQPTNMATTFIETVLHLESEQSVGISPNVRKKNGIVLRGISSNSEHPDKMLCLTFVEAQALSDEIIRVAHDFKKLCS
jgi:hypothetical protein